MQILQICTCKSYRFAHADLIDVHMQILQICTCRSYRFAHADLIDLHMQILQICTCKSYRFAHMLQIYKICMSQIPRTLSGVEGHSRIASLAVCCFLYSCAVGDNIQVTAYSCSFSAVAELFCLWPCNAYFLFTFLIL